MVVLVYRMERKSCRVERRTRYCAAAQGLWGKRRKKKEEGSLHWAALYAGLFSLSAKYIKKKERKILTSLGSRVLRLPPGQRVGYIECDEIGPSNRLTTIYILFLSLFLAIS